MLHLQTVKMASTMATYESLIMCDPEGGGGGAGGPDPPENHKSIGFLAVLVRIPCINTKLTSQHSVLGHHPIGPPAKHHLNGVSLAGR